MALWGPQLNTSEKEGHPPHVFSQHTMTWPHNNGFRKCSAASAPLYLATLKTQKNGTFNKFNTLLDRGSKGKHHFQGLLF